MSSAFCDEFVIDPTDDAVPLFEFWRPTSTWIDANVYKLLDAGFAASVIREGDAKRGTVLMIVTGQDGAARVFDQVRSPEGHSQWVPVDGSAQQSQNGHEDIVRRAVARDPDLWVLAIDATAFEAGDKSPKPCGPREGRTISATGSMQSRLADILRRHRF